VKEISYVDRITRFSKRKLLSHQETRVLHKDCPVAKMTKTRKKKLKIESKMEIQTQIESHVPKDEPEYCKGVHLKVSNK
jgi:hypothetical protein